MYIYIYTYTCLHWQHLTEQGQALKHLLVVDRHLRRLRLNDFSGTYQQISENPEESKRKKKENEWMNELMNEWMNEWMNERTNERMNEWTNEWMNPYGRNIVETMCLSVSLLAFPRWCRAYWRSRCGSWSCHQATYHSTDSWILCSTCSSLIWGTWASGSKEVNDHWWSDMIRSSRDSRDSTDSILSSFPSLSWDLQHFEGPNRIV